MRNLIVLGTAQDGGYPHAGCARECCRRAWEEPERFRLVSCLGLYDDETRERWLFDATPDFREQLFLLEEAAGPARPGAPRLDGIFLTHAHVGHYLGLAQLGREILGTSGVPVHAMPRMRSLLETSAPWEQLLRLGNIELRTLEAEAPARLGRESLGRDDLVITPFEVPHRGEYSETVGFRIQGALRAVVYLPDLDSWDAWTRSLRELLSDVDLAFVDGTFYDDRELPPARLDEVPHPRVEDTLRRARGLSDVLRSRLRFIHLNHTNPLLREKSPELSAVEIAGCGVAREGEMLEL